MPPPTAASPVPPDRTGWTFPRVLWFWSRVVLCLLLFDVLLFQVGWFWKLNWFWDLGTMGQLHRVLKQIETHAPGKPVAIAVGSSVIRMSGRAEVVARRLNNAGIETRFRNLGIDGTTATGAAIVTNMARDLDPWLVIYGAAFRDFIPSEGATFLQERFIDSTFDFEATAPKTLDERLARLVRSHWLLYRYRSFVRQLLTDKLVRLARSLLSEAHAQPHARKRTWKLEEQFTAEFRNSPAFPAWTRWYETRKFSDYEKYLSARVGALPALYRSRRALKLDLESSPQVAALDWMLRHSRERGSRVVLVYFPENPIFRSPEAAEYFDADLSDRVAAMLERKAAEYGARFVDLRNLLNDDEFIDMVHSNFAGRGIVNRTLTRIIAQEWLAAQEAAVTSGTITP